MSSVFSTVTSRHRARAFAPLWLPSLAIVNVKTGGACRSTALHAIPVVLVAWTDRPWGFVHAAVAVVAARDGGALPEPEPAEPPWRVGLPGRRRRTKGDR